MRIAVSKKAEHKVDWSKVQFGKDTPPINRKKAAETPKEGMVERQLPDGQWERTYYGKDVEAARRELDNAADEKRQKDACTDKFLVRQRGKSPRYWARDRAELFERSKTLVSLRDVYIAGFGKGQKTGCHGCGKSWPVPGGMRYLEGRGWLCKARCVSAA